MTSHCGPTRGSNQNMITQRPPAEAFAGGPLAIASRSPVLSLMVLKLQPVLPVKRGLLGVDSRNSDSVGLRCSSDEPNAA